MHAGEPPSDHPLGANLLAQFARGSGVSGINPKGLLLLLALLPQFTSRDGWPSSLQMLALGGLHILSWAVVYFTVAVLARRILRSRPGATVVVTTLAGIAMTLIGARCCSNGSRAEARSTGASGRSGFGEHGIAR